MRETGVTLYRQAGMDKTNRADSPFHFASTMHHEEVNVNRVDILAERSKKKSLDLFHIDDTKVSTGDLIC